MKWLRIALAATGWHTNAWPIEAAEDAQFVDLPTDGYSADGRVHDFSIPNVA